METFSPLLCDRGGTEGSDRNLQPPPASVGDLILIVSALTATTVRGLGFGRDPPGSAPLRRVRRGVRGLLPGQRPLLCLGWEILLQILQLTEEVIMCPIKATF